MALIGLQTDTHNPEYTIQQFLIWQPQFKAFFESPDGQAYWDELYPIANSSIFKSIWGNKWSLAMSYMIAHLLTLIAINMQAPAGDDLASIAGLKATQGVISSASVGSFQVTYEIDKTMCEGDEAKWYNLTKFGAMLYALMKTRHLPAIFVVTSDDIVPERHGYPYGK